MTTANGWTIVSLPLPWHFTTMDWTIRVPITDSTAPATGQTVQVIKWLGADGWMVTVTTPPLSADEARDWTSFLWDCQGGSVAFMLGDPLRRKPRGSDAKPTDPDYGSRSTVHTPVLVNGANAAMAGTLNLRGFQANQARVLQRGDLIGVNSRLYQVRDLYVSADASGHATVTIGPSLREVLTDGMPVATHDAQGMFRLVKYDAPYSVDQNHMYTMSFQCKEAR
jgi:hypothetical protein